MKPINKTAALGISHAKHLDDREQPAPAAFPPSVKHVAAGYFRRKAKHGRLSQIPEEQVAALLREIVEKTTVEEDGGRRFKLGGQKAAYDLLDRGLVKLAGLKAPNLRLYPDYRVIRAELGRLLGKPERPEDTIPPSWRP